MRFNLRPKSVGKLATVPDPNRPYLSGLLIRFDEGFSDATTFLRQLDPAFTPPKLPVGSSMCVKAGLAAHGESLAIGVEAMSSNGKLIVEGDEKSVLEGAVGVSYAISICVLLRSYLKNDGIEIESIPIHTFFSDLFGWLDTTERQGLATKGVQIFQEITDSKSPKVIEWREELSKAIQIWLISATSDKRTSKDDALLSQLFAELLRTLYNAIE